VSSIISIYFDQIKPVEPSANLTPNQPEFMATNSKVSPFFASPTFSELSVGPLRILMLADPSLILTAKIISGFSTFTPATAGLPAGGEGSEEIELIEFVALAE